MCSLRPCVLCLAAVLSGFRRDLDVQHSSWLSNTCGRACLGFVLPKLGNTYGFFPIRRIELLVDRLDLSYGRSTFGFQDAQRDSKAMINFQEWECVPRKVAHSGARAEWSPLTRPVGMIRCIGMYELLWIGSHSSQRCGMSHGCDFVGWVHDMETYTREALGTAHTSVIKVRNRTKIVYCDLHHPR